MKSIKIILAIVVVAAIGFFVGKLTGNISEKEPSAAYTLQNGDIDAIEHAMRQWDNQKPEIGTKRSWRTFWVKAEPDSTKYKQWEEERKRLEARKEELLSPTIENTLETKFWNLVHAGNTSKDDYTSLLQTHRKQRGKIMTFLYKITASTAAYRPFVAINVAYRKHATTVTELNDLYEAEKKNLEEKAKSAEITTTKQPAVQQTENTLETEFWELVHSGNASKHRYTPLLKKHLNQKGEIITFLKKICKNTAAFRPFANIEADDRRRAKTIKDLEKLYYIEEETEFRSSEVEL